MGDTDSDREHDEQTTATGPEPQADANEAAQVLRQAKERSETASRELRAVGERDHTERELRNATLKAVRASYYWAMAQARQSEADMLSALDQGASMESLEHLRLARDSRQWQTQVLHDEVGALRQQIADDVAAEVTASNLQLAREAAKAARTTACATVWLAIATFVLIAATIVAAIIATSGGAG